MADNYYHYGNDAVETFVKQLTEELSAQLKLLLEEKHLYQKFKVEPTTIFSEVLKRVKDNEVRSWVEAAIQPILNGRLTLSSGALHLVLKGQESSPIPVLTFILPTVRLLCANCGDRNVFKPIWYQDATNEMLKLNRRDGGGLNFDLSAAQLFFVAYQCQHCEGAPEGFLIRRDGWRFSLDGRSPMEEIQVPAYIPKNERNLFRDGIISRAAGKHLAAVFYLRTFIEQFARRVAKITGRETGDEIMAAYATKLPADKRDQMPSLREWYGKLSAPIHTADETQADALFENARGEIERHFDIRRVFKIAES